jgi:hypothetical protein
MKLTILFLHFAIVNGYSSFGRIKYNNNPTIFTRDEMSLPTYALDIGCGNGFSTNQLADRLPTTYVIGLDKNQKSIEELVERKHDLEKTLQKQTTQTKHYVQELINSEKANIALKEENHQLQITNQELKLRLTAAEATNNNLLQTTQEINNRLDINDNKIIQSMQQTIDDLRVELKTLNETSLTAIRETSNKAHETLMQEKVTSINLQTKIDSLHKELDQSHKQLELEQQNWQMQHLILQKQIKLQQKIIQTHLSQEKLQQLEQNGLELLT